MKTAGKDTGQTMEDYEISVQELSKRDVDSYILIDIRDDSSYSYGNIPGSLHVPKDILEADYEKYKDKPLILYCKKGETSAETVQFLKEKNIEAKSLKGGYLAWLMESMKQEEEQQDVYLDIEQSIRKKFKKSIWCKFTKAVREYELVKEGDKIAVCISGGKDSMLMAKLFQELQRHNRFPFEVTFLVMDPGYSKENRQIIENNAKKLHIPLTIFESDIFEAVLHVEKSPCYLCARMRRGHLYAKAKELGCNKIALGHHYADAVETLLMNLLFEGRIGCFQPVTFLDRTGVTQIRPLLYCHEDDIRRVALREGLPIVHNPCPMDGHSRRQEVKELIVSLEERYPDLKQKLFGSLQRYPLYGWNLEQTEK